MDGGAGYARLRSLPFLIGTLAGFLLCCAAGRWAGRQPVFQNFTRFNYNIAPETFFYPTVAQIVELADQSTPPGKRLVLIGGSSIMQGYGQRDAEMWTRALQKDLGDRYVVVNAAMRCGGPLDLAAVAARILQPKRPDLIFVTDSEPVGVGPISGTVTHDYAFWNSYYKNMLPLSDAEHREIAAISRREAQTKARREFHLGEELDSYFYFSDLWTLVGYRYFFTVYASQYHFFSLYKPRRLVHQDFEPEEGSYDERMKRALAQNAGLLDLVGSDTAVLYTKTPGGPWQKNESAWSAVEKTIQDAWPPGMKGHVLLTVIAHNPYFLGLVAPDIREREHLATEEFLKLCRENGVPAIAVGADFQPDWYYDWLHLGPEGGQHLASQVAAAIRAMKGTP